MSVYALIMAAGRGRRIGSDGNKVFLNLCGVPILERCVSVFENNSLIDGIIVVTGAGEIGQCRELCAGFKKVSDIIAGGESRQASVYEGVKRLPKDCSIVLVHDGARPFVTDEIIADAVRSAEMNGSGVAAVQIMDTIKKCEDNRAVETPDRALYRAVQTPQVFDRDLLLMAHEAALTDGIEATDDSALVERLGVPIYLTMGSYKNIKITTPTDMEFGETLCRNSERSARDIRVGQGYDVHRLVKDRKLILCGIEIPCELGLLGHSDADAATHALIDALLGAAGLGDIGEHFSDKDDSFKDVSSITLLIETIKMVHTIGLRPSNADITIVAQHPKLSPYKKAMEKQIASALGIKEDRVNVKAKTTEGLGFEGESAGISAQACVLLTGL